MVDNLMKVAEKTLKLNNIKDEIEKASVSLNGKKPSAREKLMLLFDEGTFIEVGAFVKQRPVELFENSVISANEGVICGYGSVDGKLSFAFCQDASILKGSISEMHAQKIVNIIEMAYKANAPIISILDSYGVRLKEGIDALAGYGKILAAFNKINGEILHICIVSGVCAGVLSFIPTIADYVVMVKDAELFLNSPDVIQSRFMEENVGTAEVAYKNGLISEICEDDKEAVIKTKSFLTLMCEAPLNDDNINRQTFEIENILENLEYDVLDIIKSIADDGKITELFGGYAKNIVTAIISMNSLTIGVIANQNMVNSGNLDAAASKKASKFIDFCTCMDMPILTLVDTNGFCAEKYENIEESSYLFSSYINTEVPKVTLILRKAYGSGYISMCSKVSGADFIMALPTAQIAILPSMTGSIFMYDKHIAASENPIIDRKTFEEQYIETYTNPYEAAKRGLIDDIIDPKTTRQLLISTFEMLLDK